MKVFIIAAISTDGFIAQDTDQVSTAWTSQEDKNHFQEMTRGAGVIVMGRKTFATIGFPLPQRLNLVYTNRTLEELSQDYSLTQTQRDQELLRVVNLSPQELVRELEEEGHDQLAVCGGASIYRQFLESGVVTDLYLTVEPVLFGQGVKLFDQTVNTRLGLVTTAKLNSQGTLLLHYRVKRGGRGES